MADIVSPLLNAVSPSATGTFYSSYFNTKDYRDFAFELNMPSTGNTGAGSVDFYIESSTEKDFTNAYKINVLTVTSPTGTNSTSFTQVVNNTTLPAASHTSTTLRQHWDFEGENIGQYIRVKYVVAGTAADYTNITVNLLANRKV